MQQERNAANQKQALLTPPVTSKSITAFQLVLTENKILLDKGQHLARL